jgi:hypothetical protein
MAVYDPDFGTGAKDIDGRGHGVTGEVGVVGVQPAEDLAARPFEGSIECIGLSHICFRLPDDGGLGCGEDLDGTVGGCSVHNDVLDIRVRLRRD